MPDYLSNAACRGHRPRNLAARRLFPRPDLVAKLLRERHVARFLVAPDGYGKTSVALEYADTIFRFEHVFWLDCKSPCFLRDLDRGILASTLLEADNEPFLMVLEDVPPLDPDRIEALSADMDRVLDRGCEVLVTCAPTCDAFERHRDRIKLSSKDLLLSDAEIDAQRTAGERSAKPAAAFATSRRVPGLIWAAPGDEPFLEATLHEELPNDLLLPLFLMLVLEEGTFADIAAFGRFASERAELLAERYPHLGIDRRGERFSTARFSLMEVAAAFTSKLDALAKRSLFPNRDTLATRTADALAAQRRFERACEAIRLLGSHAACARWLVRHGTALLEAACMVPACEAYRSLGGEVPNLEARLEVDEACRRAVLGERREACTLARRVAGASGAGADERALAALVMASCGDGAERQRAEDAVASLARLPEAHPVVSATTKTATWALPATVRAALSASNGKAAEVWLAWYDRGARGGAVALAAFWVLNGAVERPAVPGAKADGRLERLASIVRARLSRVDTEPLSLLDAFVGTAYERACEQGVVPLPTLDARASHAVHCMEMALYRQRSALEHLERERAERRRSFVATHPDSFRVDPLTAERPAASPSAPLLTVNLFGGLDVRIGNEPVDLRRFRRQKVKTLLALLVLNRGREFSRDKLVTLLWPDSDLEAARKNFYSIWSMLRRALSTPEGACPYLIRQQNGVRLDANLLVTDVAQLEEVCRSLLFEQPGYGGWAHLFAQVNDKFSDDLLPSDDDNSGIASLRADYRNRLVDALVTASARLVSAGEAQEGLWFARAALQRDRTREDAYIALMNAQLASGQRTAALETYFSCRRFLVDELGIDPSLELMELYRSIIETEAILE